MTKQPSILFLATFVALLALITLVLGPGRLLLPDRGATYASDFANTKRADHLL